MERTSGIILKFWKVRAWCKWRQHFSVFGLISKIMTFNFHCFFFWILKTDSGQLYHICDDCYECIWEVFFYNDIGLWWVYPVECVRDQTYDISWQCGDRSIRFSNAWHCSVLFQPPRTGFCIMQSPSLQVKSGSLNDWTISIAGQDVFVEWEVMAEMYTFSMDSS